VRCHGGDHGDPACVDDVQHRVRVDAGDLTDQAEVDHFAVDRGFFAGRGEQARVLARDPDRVRAVRVDQADEFPADLAGEHHADDVHRLGCGDSQAAAELAVDAEPVEHRGDLRAAAVDDDRLQPRQSQEHHVLCERGLQLVVDHRVAAVLDHDGRAVEALQPRQRLDEYACFFGRGGQPRVGGDGVFGGFVDGHEEYALFSST